MKSLSRAKWSLALLGVLMLTAVAGCGANNGNDVRQQQVPAGNGNAMQRQQPAGRVQNNNEQIQIADKAAQSIARLPEVRQANVLITGENAYVAAVLDQGRNRITRETEDKIAQRVRGAAPGILNVYVSTNPDFVDRINSYVDDIQEGRPVIGFVEQFNEMVQRLFPNAR